MYRQLGQQHRRKPPVIDGPRMGYGVRPDLGQLNIPKFFERLFTPPKIIREAAMNPAIRARILSTAAAAFPAQYARVEEAITGKIKELGLEKVQQRVTEAVQNPIVWIGGGALVLLLVLSMRK